MKRSRSVIGVTVAAGLAVAGLSGCSLFQHGASPDVPDSAMSAAPSPAVSASVSPSVTAAPSAPVPPTVPGYSLGPPKSDVVRQFQTVTGKVPGVFSGLTVRTLSKGNAASGFVVLLGLHQELVGNTTVERSLLPGLLKGMAGDGAKTSTQKIGDVDAATASTRTASFLGWYKAGTVVLVLSNSTDLTPTVTFAKAYLAAG